MDTNDRDIQAHARVCQLWTLDGDRVCGLVPGCCRPRVGANTGRKICAGPWLFHAAQMGDVDAMYEVGIAVEEYRYFTFDDLDFAGL